LIDLKQVAAELRAEAESLLPAREAAREQAEAWDREHADIWGRWHELDARFQQLHRAARALDPLPTKEA